MFDNINNSSCQSSNSLQHYGLDILQNMLKDSIINRTACFKAGVLGFLLDWFREEDREDMISKIAELIQIIGGHSISGKDIRKIFALLRREKRESIQKHRSLLLTSIRYMLKEKGPEAFFEFNGCDSVCSGVTYIFLFYLCALSSVIYPYLLLYDNFAIFIIKYRMSQHASLACLLGNLLAGTF